VLQSSVVTKEMNDPLGASAKSFTPTPLSVTEVITKPEVAQVKAGVAATTTTKEEARIKGYTGDSCVECGSFQMVRNGSCLKCLSCGSTTGCS